VDSCPSRCMSVAARGLDGAPWRPGAYGSLDAQESDLPRLQARIGQVDEEARLLQWAARAELLLCLALMRVVVWQQQSKCRVFSVLGRLTVVCSDRLRLASFIVSTVTAPSRSPLPCFGRPLESGFYASTLACSVPQRRLGMPFEAAARATSPPSYPSTSSLSVAPRLTLFSIVLRGVASRSCGAAWREWVAHVVMYRTVRALSMFDASARGGAPGTPPGPSGAVGERVRPRMSPLALFAPSHERAEPSVLLRSAWRLAPVRHRGAICGTNRDTEAEESRALATERR